MKNDKPPSKPIEEDVERYGRLRRGFLRFNRGILGVPYATDEEKSEERPPILGERPKYSRAASNLSFGELVLCVFLALNAGTILYFWDIRVWLGFISLVGVLGLAYAGFVFYRKGDLFKAGIMVSIVPLITIVVFAFRSDYIWIIVYVGVVIIGTLGSRIIASEDVAAAKMMDEVEEEVKSRPRKKKRPPKAPEEQWLKAKNIGDEDEDT